MISFPINSSHHSNKKVLASIFDDGLNRITAREREVLDLLVEGYSSREIGSQLGVSTKTIEAHRARINDKMRSDDLAHLVRMVLASRDA